PAARGVRQAGRGGDRPILRIRGSQSQAGACRRRRRIARATAPTKSPAAIRTSARTTRPERSLPVKGSEPLAAGTGLVGTATGAVPPWALLPSTATLLPWCPPPTPLWPPLCPLLEPGWPLGGPLEPELPGGGCCGYWSA